MRPVILALTVALLPVAAPAESIAGAGCAEQAALVMQVVEGRRDGTDLDAAREDLAAVLPAETASLLADWVYSLPEAQLTEAIGVAWQQQCEAL